MGSVNVELPEIPADDSMLSRKFGREIANYFAGSPLNRVSFLRTNHAFLRSAFAHPSARFMLLDNLSPLVTQERPPQLVWSTRDSVTPLTGADPFAKTEEEMIRDFNSEETRPVVLFLGIDEKSIFASSTPPAEAEESGGAANTDDAFQYKQYRGSPYFAVDVTPRGSYGEAAQRIIDAYKAKGLLFFTNARALSFVAEEAAVYGQARALLDWNARNPFCAQCSQPTLSVNAGTKRVCPPTDLAGVDVASGQPPRERLPCATRHGVSNLSFPRTDPTVIVACVSHDGTRMLLGRQRRWPAYWYSTLAGFLEPGESIEEAVRREVWEESGVTLSRVVLHSSQPWPFPANLMIGAIGQAAPGKGEEIFLGNDPELEDARWFPVEEVQRALLSGTSPLGEGPAPGYKEGDLRIPPRTAIANQLMTAVVEGFLAATSKM